MTSRSFSMLIISLFLYSPSVFSDINKVTLTPVDSVVVWKGLGAKQVKSATEASVRVRSLWCDFNPIETFWVECESIDKNDADKRLHYYNARSLENLFETLRRNGAPTKSSDGFGGYPITVSVTEITCRKALRPVAHDSAICTLEFQKD